MSECVSGERYSDKYPCGQRGRRQSYCAAQFLKLKHPEVRKAYVCGASGLAEELQLAGVDVAGAETKEAQEESARRTLAAVSCLVRNALPTACCATVTEEEYLTMTADPEIGAVVVGWDLSFSFRRLCYASLLLQHIPKCLFVATNLDPCDRLADRNMPGNGCAVAAIETSVGM